MVIGGNDLYNAAVANGQSVSLRDGVSGYLTLNGHYEDITHLCVTVYKLTSDPIIKLSFDPRTTV